MMRVLGKDKSEEAYRLGLEIGGTEIVALIPEALLSAEHGRTDRVPHQAAYEWIEPRPTPWPTRSETLHSGAQPRAPFDQITLEPAT
jgi:hypothetical protein